MNLEMFDGEVSQCLLDLVGEIEAYCQFEILMQHEPLLAARGMLSHEPGSITLYLKEVPAQPAVVVHELCHARRYFNRQVWITELIPYRQLPGSDRSAADDIDNQIEHLFIHAEMNDEFGFAPDDTHIKADLAALKFVTESFHRKTTLLMNWLLINFHFTKHLPEIRSLIECEALTEVANRLLAEVKAAGTSKAKIIASVAKALDIPQKEIRLRRHATPPNGHDEGDMIAIVLAEEEKND